LARAILVRCSCQLRSTSAPSTCEAPRAARGASGAPMPARALLLPRKAPCKPRLRACALRRGGERRACARLARRPFRRRRRAKAVLMSPPLQWGARRPALVVYHHPPLAASKVLCLCAAR
jgi:hypothetical protein